MAAPQRQLRMALVGGGGTGFIGRVHARAATMDRLAVLVAGALSSDRDRAQAAGKEFGLSEDRTYSSWQELVHTEAQRPDDQRIDFVSIATPNHTHFPIAKAAIEAGFHVTCDKPLAISLDEAVELQRLVERTGAVLAITHNYSGYPLVRQARDIIAAGDIGSVQAIRIQYIQGGLRAILPGVTPTRGAWKQDPAKNGPLGAMSDIGTHAYHLARFTTQLRPERVSCHLRTWMPQRLQDDYGHAIVSLEGGVPCLITVSQITHGRLNDLMLEIDGSTGSLSWRQEVPNQLILRRFGQPSQTFDRHPGADYLSAQAKSVCRLPAGHPEGFYEAFANVYRASFRDMMARQSGVPIDLEAADYPTVRDGVEGIRFVEQCAVSSHNDGAWAEL